MLKYQIYYIESRGQSPRLRLYETLSRAKSHLKPAEKPGLAWLLTAGLARLLALGRSRNITT
jgi:hypothetical protein